MRTGTWVSTSMLCVAFSACNGRIDSGLGSSEETFEVVNGQDTFRGTGNLARLDKIERINYLGDRKYLREIVPRGQAVEINHADPRQHRFAVARLKMNGKTPENSPALFKAMADLVGAHAARGFAVGTVLPLDVVNGGLQSQHEMLGLGRTAQAATTVATSSLASRKDRLTHGFVDCSAYDGDGNGIGDSIYVEVFGDMRFFAPQCHGDMTLAAVNSAEGDSFLSETIATNGATRQSYVMGPIVNFDAIAPVLGAPTVNQPNDGNADNKISVCLDRVWTADCDVNNTGMLTLKLPLKGSVSISNATFDWATIAHYQTDRQDTFSHLYVTLVTNGGGCRVPPTTASFTMREFWKQVTGTGNQLAWDLSTDATKWAQFSADCRLVQDRVNLYMELRLPYQSPDTSGTILLEITNDTAPVANYRIPYPIEVTNSCLAEGTLIATSGKRASKIEDIHIGDKLASPYAEVVTVTDTAVGTERSPMVRIADALGHELLMTEMHPVHVIERGMVPAKYLQVGDRVKTQAGPSELVRVSRESYTGRVYNLKVGDQREAAGLLVDQTTVYANGILVGDGQIQSKYEAIDLHRDTGPKLIRTSWKVDYQSSVKRSGNAP
jgi:hypothetical protein